jgi:hypothetical protein
MSVSMETSPRLSTSTSPSCDACQQPVLVVSATPRRQHLTGQEACSQVHRYGPELSRDDALRLTSMIAQLFVRIPCLRHRGHVLVFDYVQETPRGLCV